MMNTVTGEITYNGTLDLTSQEQPLLPTPKETITQLEAIHAFQQACQRHLIKGHDYGIIPGTDKPTLLKPGAEKIAKLLGLADHYDILQAVEDWDKGLFAYRVKCRLEHMRSGHMVSTGLAMCSTMEGKYRWRWLWPDAAKAMGLTTENTAIRKVKTRNGLVTQYRAANDDTASQANTVLKMACKRALVAAALSAGRLSEIFTQDLEDAAVIGQSEETDDKPEPSLPLVTPAQLRTIRRLMEALNWTPARLTEWFIGQFGFGPRQITQDQADGAIGVLKARLDAGTLQEEPTSDVNPSGGPDDLNSKEMPPGEAQRAPTTFAELYSRAEQLMMTKQDVLVALGVTHQIQIADIGAAWRTIIAAHKGTSEPI